MIMGGDLALSLRKDKFLWPNFRMTFIRKKIVFNADKFLMTFLIIHCTFVFLCCLKSVIR